VDKCSYEYGRGYEFKVNRNTKLISSEIQVTVKPEVILYDQNTSIIKCGVCENNKSPYIIQFDVELTKDSTYFIGVKIPSGYYYSLLDDNGYPQGRTLDCFTIYARYNIKMANNYNINMAMNYL